MSVVLMGVCRFHITININITLLKKSYLTFLPPHTMSVVQQWEKLVSYTYMIKLCHEALRECYDFCG